MHFNRIGKSIALCCVWLRPNAKSFFAFFTESIMSDRKSFKKANRRIANLPSSESDRVPINESDYGTPDKASKKKRKKQRKKLKHSSQDSSAPRRKRKRASGSSDDTRSASEITKDLLIEQELTQLSEREIMFTPKRRGVPSATIVRPNTPEQSPFKTPRTPPLLSEIVTPLEDTPARPVSELKMENPVVSEEALPVIEDVELAVPIIAKSDSEHVESNAPIGTDKIGVTEETAPPISEHVDSDEHSVSEQIIPLVSEQIIPPVTEPVDSQAPIVTEPELGEDDEAPKSSTPPPDSHVSAPAADRETEMHSTEPELGKNDEAPRSPTPPPDSHVSAPTADRENEMHSTEPELGKNDEAPRSPTPPPDSHVTDMDTIEEEDLVENKDGQIVHTMQTPTSTTPTPSPTLQPGQKISGQEHRNVPINFPGNIATYIGTSLAPLF